MRIELYNSSMYSEVQDSASSIVNGGMFFSIFEQRNYGDNMFKLEIDEDELIAAADFFYRDDYEKLNPVLESISELLDCSIDMAEELLDESISVFDQDAMDELGLQDEEEALDIEWMLQDQKFYAASILGYKAVEVRDENVYSVIVDVAEFKDRIKPHAGDRQISLAS